MQQMDLQQVPFNRCEASPTLPRCTQRVVSSPRFAFWLSPSDISEGTQFSDF